MSHDQKDTYEIHIVSYNKTDIVDAPPEYERLTITDSQICLNQVLSYHDIKTKEDALKIFKRTIKWFEESRQDGEVHIKLEYFKDLKQFNKLQFTSNSEIYPVLPQSLSYDDNYYIGGLGWDVHIDGVFDTDLKDFLIKRGWVYLNYLSDDGKQEYVTLTQHYINENKCREAFEMIFEFIQKVGGFSGVIYWEDPVRYMISTEKNV